MKPIRLAACALAVSAMLAGCSNQMETETTSATELTGAAQAEAEGTYTGQVTSIEDGIVTLALGEYAQRYFRRTVSAAGGRDRPGPWRGRNAAGRERDGR